MHRNLDVLDELLQKASNQLFSSPIWFMNCNIIYQHVVYLQLSLSHRQGVIFLAEIIIDKYECHSGP